MTSFQISISPSRRAATRCVSRFRRAIQKALAEEQEKSGITQSDIARSIGVHRSVINREIRGQKDITLGRIGELAWALGREIVFDLQETNTAGGTNVPAIKPGAVRVSTSQENTVTIDDQPLTATARAA